MSEYFILPPLFGVAGLVIAFIIYKVMVGYSAGGDNVKKIADQIHLGAMVFMHREYKMLGIFSAVLLVLVFVFLGPNTAIAFTAGAVSSAIAGYLGMFAATKANVRTTVAAHEHGQPEALTVAFYGGSIMGLLVASPSPFMTRNCVRSSGSSPLKSGYTASAVLSPIQSANDSFSQRSFHHCMVTRLPNH